MQRCHSKIWEMVVVYKKIAVAHQVPPIRSLQPKKGYTQRYH